MKKKKNQRVDNAKAVLKVGPFLVEWRKAS